MDSPAPHQNSPTGWWLAALLERRGGKVSKPYWHNYRLVRASHWRQAFRRALELGESGSQVGNQAFGAGHEFIGVTDLVPIYEAFEDGAEILWEEYDADETDPAKPPLSTFTEAELEAIYEPKTHIC
jgi:hypothetical protein